MTSRKIIAAGLPMLALLLTACGGKQYEPETVLPVRPEVSTCPAPATPPTELVKRPTIVDFLSRND